MENGEGGVHGRVLPPVFTLHTYPYASSLAPWCVLTAWISWYLAMRRREGLFVIMTAAPPILRGGEAMRRREGLFVIMTQPRPSRDRGEVFMHEPCSKLVDDVSCHLCGTNPSTLQVSQHT